MKILNNYAGIGGNRKLWGDEHEITAVEYDDETASIYKDMYPNDRVIVTDGHQYLLDNFKEFDFIWSSPPCPSHSRINTTIVGKGQRGPVYPDMRLYEEILLLKHWFEGIWVVENVIPYYDPLISAQITDRHLWWANFKIGNFSVKNPIGRPFNEIKDSINLLEMYHGVCLKKYNPKGNNSKQKMLRNMVHPETGEYIMNCALKKMQKYEQPNLFNF